MDFSNRTGKENPEEEQDGKEATHSWIVASESRSQVKKASENCTALSVEKKALSFSQMEVPMCLSAPSQLSHVPPCFLQRLLSSALPGAGSSVNRRQRKAPAVSAKVAANKSLFAWISNPVRNPGS